MPDPRTPDCCPDGARIAYVSKGDVWVVDASGSNPRWLTTTKAAETSVAWSPDGTGLAFSRRSGGRSTAWLMSADGSSQRRLLPIDSQLAPASQALR